MSKKYSVRFVVGAFFLFFLGLCAGIFTFIIVYFDPLHDIGEKKNSSSKMILFDNRGKNLSQEINPSIPSYKYFYQIPVHIINAFLAREDAQFFHHNGISFSGIMRSVMINIIKRKFAQGASTITQQMIKLHLNDLKKTLTRKIKEQLYAVCTELHHSKEEILEYYLNILYFGLGIYGIENASKIFWNKSCHELTIAQAATLAGIVQRPEHYNPYKDYNVCVKKRNIVLKKMHENKYIATDAYEKALKEPLTINSYHRELVFSNINFLVSTFMEQNNNENEKKFIYTTCDGAVQKKMSLLFDKYSVNLQKKVPAIQGASVLLNYRTGEIVACCNGNELYKNKMVRTLVNRQIGSTIKPLVLYYAFEKGDNPETIYVDEPIVNVSGWAPRNYDRKFLGPMPLAEALVRSNNTIPIKILQKYGIEDFIFFLQTFFNKEKYIPPYLSLALGTIECSALEMAYCIGVLKNNGIGMTPYCIKIAHDSNGNILMKNVAERKVLCDPLHIAALMPILGNIGARLCTRLAMKKPKGFIGKTGTNNESKTCWFVGATDTYAIATWFGTDKNDSLAPYNISSIATAAQYSIELLNLIEK